MDVTRTHDGSAASRFMDAGQERSAALAEARKRARDARLADASQSETRRAEQIAALREIIAETSGVNTRIAIARNPSGHDFFYKAIDRKTGEVVQEWPPERVAVLMADLGPAGKEAPLGLFVDREA